MKDFFVTDIDFEINLSFYTAKGIGIVFLFILRLYTELVYLILIFELGKQIDKFNWCYSANINLY